MPIDPTSVAKAARRGLYTAQVTYRAWSGLWAPPEPITTVSVAKAVHSVDGVAKVTLESNIDAVLSWAQPRPGPKPDLPRQGRFDIVVWRSTNVPSGVIEVKSIWNARLIHDVRRVCNTIRGTKRIRWGLVACICALDDAGRPGVDLVAEQANNAVREAEMAVDRLKLKLKRHRSRPRNEDDGGWLLQVLEIHK